MTELEIEEEIEKLNRCVEWTGRGQMITSFQHLRMLLRRATGENHLDDRTILQEFSKEFGVKIGMVRRQARNFNWIDAMVSFDAECQRMQFFLMIGVKKPDDYRTRKRNEKS